MAASSLRFPLGDGAGGAGGVPLDDGLEAEFGDDVADLAEGDGMGVDALEVGDGRAAGGEEAVFDALEVLADDEEAAGGE